MLNNNKLNVYKLIKALLAITKRKRKKSSYFKTTKRKKNPIVRNAQKNQIKKRGGKMYIFSFFDGDGSDNGTL